MNVIAFTALTGFIGSTLIGAATLVRAHSSLLGKVGALFYFGVSGTTIVFFGYLQSSSYEQARFWWSMDVFWIIPSALFVPLTLLFVHREKTLRKPLVAIPTVLIPLSMEIAEITTHYFTGPPVKYPWGWFFGPPTTETAAFLVFCWQMGISVFSLYFGIRFYREQKNPLQRRLSLFLILLPPILLFFMNIMETILLALETQYPLQPFVVVLIIIPIAFLMWKYDVFAMTFSFAADSIVETMGDSLILIDPSGRIIRTNSSARSLLQWSSEGILESNLKEIISVSSSDDRILTDVLHSGKTEDTVLRNIETNVVRKFDTPIPVELSARGLFDHAGEKVGVVIVARDISERKQNEKLLAGYRKQLEKTVVNQTQKLVWAQKQIQDLGESIISAKDEESSRIAGELHDDLGQILTTMKIYVTLLCRKMERNDELTKKTLTLRLDELNELTDVAIERVRKISRALRPKIIEDKGLLEALEHFLNEFSKYTEIDCQFEASIGDAHLESNLCLSVFRIVQESLTNVARHAQATSVRVSLEAIEGVLSGTITDNGRGISSNSLSNSDSMGIAGMHERVRLCGGTLEVAPNQKRGTQVHFKIPVAMKSS